MARAKDGRSTAAFSASPARLRPTAMGHCVLVLIVSLLTQRLGAQQLGLPPDISLLAGGIRQHNAMDPFNVYGASDPSRLFVQMAPTVHFDNHVVPAHMVGAYEKTPQPEVITLPSAQLGDMTLAGVPQSLNRNIGSQFQQAAAASFAGNGHPATGIHAEYTGKAQGLDLELQNPDTRSAMQHAGEGDHEDAIPLKDRPYNNLQSSKEQENAAFDFSTASGDAVLQKAVSQKATRVRKVPSEVNDIAETAYRSRSAYEHREHHAPKKQRKSKKGTTYTASAGGDDDDHAVDHYSEARAAQRKKKISRTKVEEADDSEEQGQGRRLFNIQFGGGGGSSSSGGGSGGRRKTHGGKSSSRRKPPPPPASNEDDNDDDEPAQESRRSLFRVPFRVFRGVTLNRGDDGALAFNINLG